MPGVCVSKAAVRAKDVVLGYGKTVAIARSSFEIPIGQVTAVIGPNGSGKSTLLNTLGCLDRPTAGSYYLDDRDVAQLSDGELTQIRRNEIGFVFQFFHLVPRLTAAENVALPLVFAGVARSERRQRVAEALEQLVQVGASEPDVLVGVQQVGSPGSRQAFASGNLSPGVRGELHQTASAGAGDRVGCHGALRTHHAVA